jgi:hypothetical protein
MVHVMEPELQEIDCNLTSIFRRHLAIYNCKREEPPSSWAKVVPKENREERHWTGFILTGRRGKL